jgi:hypothetical protein
MTDMTTTEECLGCDQAVLGSFYAASHLSPSCNNSSSHVSPLQAGGSPAQCAGSAPGHSPLGLAMMLKAGWKPGQALGRDPAEGLTTPIPTVMRMDRTCIGHEEAVCVQAEEVSNHPRFVHSRSAEKRAQKRHRQRQRYSFPPEPEGGQYGNWDGNVGAGACCRFDPSHRLPLRKLKEHEARCPSNPDRRQPKSH